MRIKKVNAAALECFGCGVMATLAPTFGALLIGSTDCYVLTDIFFAIGIVCCFAAIVLYAIFYRMSTIGEWPYSNTLATMGITSIVLSCIPICFGLQLGKTSTANQRSKRCDDWRKIGNAIHNYASDHDNRFPPAASKDFRGRPLLSWRVLILPYLDKKDLFKRFRLDKPWDSEQNIKLLPEMPDVYKSPYVFRVPKYHTFYQAIVGRGTAFDPAHMGLKFGTDFPDGSLNTILIAEATRAVPWTKPEDIPYDSRKPLPEFGARSHFNARSIFLGRHVSMAHVYEFLTCDGGRMQLWRESLSEKNLRNAIERNDGNPVEW